MKLDIQTLQPVWTIQLGANATSVRHKNIARGMACATSPDGQSVWFGGVVEDGGHIHESGLEMGFGGTDIFVSKVLASSGELLMVKQMGTEKNDTLANRGGLVTDNTGNVAAIGNTYGSFYRERFANETQSDVFVLTINSLTGEVAPVSSSSRPPEGPATGAFAQNNPTRASTKRMNDTDLAATSAGRHQSATLFFAAAMFAWILKTLSCK